MATKTVLSNTHAQLQVVEPDSREFLQWTQAHLDQGFILGRRSLTFSTPDCIRSSAEVVLADHFDLKKSKALRVIRLPLRVETGNVSIETLTASHTVALKPGEYAVYFEYLGRDASDAETTLVRFTFVPEASSRAKAAVLRADDELEVPKKLVLTSDPIA
jgi:hypothetical protein